MVSNVKVQWTGVAPFFLFLKWDCFHVWQLMCKMYSNTFLNDFMSLNVLKPLLNGSDQRFCFLVMDFDHH